MSDGALSVTLRSVPGGAGVEVVIAGKVSDPPAALTVWLTHHGTLRTGWCAQLPCSWDEATQTWQRRVDLDYPRPRLLEVAAIAREAEEPSPSMPFDSAARYHLEMGAGLAPWVTGKTAQKAVGETERQREEFFRARSGLLARATAIHGTNSSLSSTTPSCLW